MARGRERTMRFAKNHPSHLRKDGPDVTIRQLGQGCQRKKGESPFYGVARKMQDTRTCYTDGCGAPFGAPSEGGRQYTRMRGRRERLRPSHRTELHVSCAHAARFRQLRALREPCLFRLSIERSSPRPFSLSVATKSLPHPNPPHRAARQLRNLPLHLRPRPSLPLLRPVLRHHRTATIVPMVRPGQGPSRHLATPKERAGKWRCRGTTKWTTRGPFSA